MRQLLNYIVSLFKRDNIDSNLIDFSTCDVLEEKIEIKYSDIYSEIKNLINEKDVYEQKLNIQHQIQKMKIGDIIWAKRYSDENEKFFIPEGHREGPFIVLGKRDGDLVCIKGTSVSPVRGKLKSYYEVSNKYYSLKKNTYFYFSSFYIIDDTNFIKYFDSLKIEDYHKLIRKMKINNSACFKGKNVEINYFIQAGDFIKYMNNKYIILDVNQSKMSCIPVYTTSNCLSLNHIKNLDYSKLITFDLNIKCTYLSTINDNMFLHILKKEKDYFEYEKRSIMVQRGDVIFKDQKYFYVYGEEGNDWLVFEIFENSNDGLDQIIIAKKAFYTDYSSKNISKKDKDRTVLIADDCEIENIKLQKKSYKKSNTCECIQANKSLIKIGDIVVNKFISGDRYIVVDKYDGYCECLSINYLIRGEYSKLYFSKGEVKKARNTSLTGIKWFEENETFNLRNLSDNQIIEQIIRVQNEYISNKKNNQLKKLIN